MGMHDQIRAEPFGKLFGDVEAWKRYARLIILCMLDSNG